MEKVVGDYSFKQLIDAGEVLNRYLFGRKTPMERKGMKEKIRELAEMVENDPKKFKLPERPPDTSNETLTQFYNATKKQRIEEAIRQRVYAWQAINYDSYQSLLYLFGRAPQEYASLIRIFSEIKKRDVDFSPSSFLDFGSGVGTGTWAASELWKPSLYEYYLIDASKYMNDLSDLILRDGAVNKTMSLRNVYHRQFLPSRTAKYDIVLSAYSLFEQQTLKNRLELANNLWNKTSQYLIFVENGTNSGFTILNEIREFLIDTKEKTNEDAFIFSPCPHDSECPRYALNDGTPCNFDVRFYTLPFSGSRQIHNHLYSYLVIKKGKPNDRDDKWARVVRPTVVRSKHSVCRFCTKDGDLREVVFTQSKHGRQAYRCARNSNWGDQYPAIDFEIYENETKHTAILEKIKQKQNSPTETEIIEPDKFGV